MSKNSKFLEYILELLEVSGGITHARMFGGYVIRKHNLPIALIFEDEVYLKVDDSNIDDYKALDSKPFTYEKQGKTIEISNWSLPADILEDQDELMIWVEKSYEVSKRKKS